MDSAQMFVFDLGWLFFAAWGMVLAAVSLLDEIPNPTEQDVRLGLEGNLCRCTGYHNIVKSVLAAAETMRGAK